MPETLPCCTWFSKPLRWTPPSRMIQRTLLSLLVVLPFCCSASAQVVVPGLRFGSSMSVFTTFTDVKPNYQYFTDLAVYGFSAGGFIQSHHVIGLELRGSITRWGGGQHEEAALGGPRAALHLGRFSPYIAGLGGAGNVWIGQDHPPPGHERKSKEALGPQWTILGGLDFHLHRRWSLRAAELSYSHVYTDHQTVRPIGASAGIVYRFR
jgi:hypothetical protein